MLKGLGSILKKASEVAARFGKGGDYGGLGGPLSVLFGAGINYFGAKSDKRAGEQQMAEFLRQKNLVSNFYNNGGDLPEELTPPPLTSLVKNIDFQGMGEDGQPIYGDLTEEDVTRSRGGGLMGLANGGQVDISYSASTGIPTLNQGGPTDNNFYKNIRTAEDNQNRTPGLMSYFATGGETDPDNFPRKTGKIEGPGTKTSDSIPAMLSKGEFVQRTDAVNGAGVMMGANNAQEAQKKGAQFMYALQDRLANMGKKV